MNSVKELEYVIETLKPKLAATGLDINDKLAVANNLQSAIQLHWQMTRKPVATPMGMAWNSQVSTPYESLGTVE